MYELVVEENMRLKNIENPIFGQAVQEEKFGRCDALRLYCGDEPGFARSSAACDDGDSQSRPVSGIGLPPAGFDILESGQFSKEFGQRARRVWRVGLGDLELLETGEAVFSIFAFSFIVNDDAVKIESDAKFVVVFVVGFSGTAGPPAPTAV